MNFNQAGRFTVTTLAMWLSVAFEESALAALIVSDPSATYTIDFDNTHTGVNNGAYAGTGFSATPAPGQLDSTAWAVTSFEAELGGNLDFGEENLGEAYTRGASPGGVTLFGLYGFDVSNGGVENRAFGIQPFGDNWAPGMLTLRLQNTSGQELTEFTVSYLTYVLNNAPRTNTFNFSHSADDNTYVPVAELDLASPAAADSPAAWVSTPNSTTLTGLSIPHNGYYYLQWYGDDAGGAGARDEFALDDIVISNFVTNSVVAPEPAALFLALLACISLLVSFRQRK